ncbi:MAG: FKBP-type peptidyl-prolyl cis-trans isomerase [Chlamydiales bacterium]|jgi:FKBP-type peptidyl-prolyl cis-trans isomerase
MRITPLQLSLALLALGSTSCGLLSSSNVVPVDRAERTTPAGVQIHDLTLGTGAFAQNGDRVTVDFVARLTDRSEIDSTYDRGQPVEFTIGEATIAGWNEGVAGMRVGGRRSLVIPAHLAFGQAGIPNRVPAGATLLYEMELLAIAPK